MNYTITTDKGSIDYTLIRKKMKSIRIRVTGASKVVVSAPYHTAQSRIDQFVQNNNTFILSHLEDINSKRRLHYPADYQNGDTFWCLGKEMLLRVDESANRYAILNDDILSLHMPQGSDFSQRKVLFILWMNRYAKVIFSQRAEKILPEFSDLVKQSMHISVKNMLTRWGSINTKRYTISLTVHLLRCEIPLIDYVIKHELCHFAYANHTKAFYQMLDKHCPGYKQLDKKLSAYGLIDF
ncbi:MAG: M48 family metallopeptidase [Christensenellales bacterium]|jgi:predicted metal-dependent hydrolase